MEKHKFLKIKAFIGVGFALLLVLALVYMVKVDIPHNTETIKNSPQKGSGDALGYLIATIFGTFLFGFCGALGSVILLLLASAMLVRKRANNNDSFLVLAAIGKLLALVAVFIFLASTFYVLSKVLYIGLTVLIAISIVTDIIFFIKFRRKNEE